MHSIFSSKYAHSFCCSLFLFCLYFLIFDYSNDPGWGWVGGGGWRGVPQNECLEHPLMKIAKETISLAHWSLKDVEKILQVYFKTDFMNSHLEYFLCFQFPVPLVIDTFSENTIDEVLTLVQEMPWYHQAASHYMSSCWANEPIHYCRMASLGHKELTKVHKVHCCHTVSLDQKVKSMYFNPTYEPKLCQCYYEKAWNELA